MLTNKNISKTLNIIVLLILLTPASVYALTITIDGRETDWMPSNWICPGGTRCSIAEMSDNSVWLCCDQYPNPTKCQLMWRDKSGDAPAVVDAIYARLYTNSSGLYLYILIKNLMTDSNVTIWFCDTQLNINIGSPPSGVVRAISSEAVELYIPFSVPISKECDFGLEIVRRPRGTIQRDLLEVLVNRTTITIVNLMLSGSHIVGGFYDSIPIPVPEPWYISLAVLLSTSLALLFFVKKVKI